MRLFPGSKDLLTNIRIGTDKTVKTEDTHSGIQVVFLQPVIKDPSNICDDLHAFFLMGYFFSRKVLHRQTNIYCNRLKLNHTIKHIHTQHNK